jgi:Carboxypeptidase regulatory-like domain
VSLGRQNTGGSYRLQTGVPTLGGARRETGEIAVEGIGTLEIAASDAPGLRRMDVREVDPALASAARQSLLAAYRYQRTADVPPQLTLDVKRFPDAAVLAAIAERAVATTLVTTEGRTLTEITMWMRNRAQPFMKVGLPDGASMLSVEVGGAPAKPVEGKDGSRVPLLRPGFRPDGLYSVSFVYLNTGAPFTKKGDMQMTLPKMDVPVNVLEWELFVPDRYRVDRFDGNMLTASLLEQDRGGGAPGGIVGGVVGGLPEVSPGQIVGRVVDQTGAPLPGATIRVDGAGRGQTVITDANGGYVLSGVPSGPIAITGQMSGFATARRTLVFDQRPRQVDMTLTVGKATESVTVTADAPVIDTRSSDFGRRLKLDEQRQAAPTRPNAVQEITEASANVQSLQRRASGVLPVRMDVPRAGTSHRFVKPLVIDEPAVVNFRYKRR